MITVGIIGCGFVGGALKAWLEKNNKEVKVVVSDPPKGMNDDISGADVYFLQIHVPTKIFAISKFAGSLKVAITCSAFSLPVQYASNQWWLSTISIILYLTESGRLYLERIPYA